MSDIKTDFQEIEALLSLKSPLGAFARKDEPFYQTLRAEVEYTGRVLAKAEYVHKMRSIEHKLAKMKLQAFVAGEELPKKKVEAIEEEISNFITELKEGKWN